MQYVSPSGGRLVQQRWFGLVSFKSIHPDLSIEGPMSNVQIEQWVLEIFTCLCRITFVLSFLHWFKLDLLFLFGDLPKPISTKTSLSLLYFTLLALNSDPGPHRMLCYQPYSAIGLPTDNSRGGIHSKSYPNHEMDYRQKWNLACILLHIDYYTFTTTSQGLSIFTKSL